MKPILNRLLLALPATALLFSTQLALAAEKPSLKLADFDLNHDGRLDEKEYQALQTAAAAAFGYQTTQKEASDRAGDIDVTKFLVNDQLPTDPQKVGAFMMAMQSVKVYQFDANLDGKFDASDLPLQQRYADRQIGGSLADWTQSFEKLLADQPDRKIESVKTALVALEKLQSDPTPSPLGIVRIRADTDVTLTDLANMEKAKPATVSFTHDYKDKGREVTNIQFALIAPIKANDIPVRTLSTQTPQIYYLPSVAWQKINGTDKGDVDLITTSFGLGISWRGQKPFPSTHQIAFGASYVTDREKKSELWKADLSYTPVYSHWAIGAFKPVGTLPLDGMLELKLRTTTIEVRDAGLDTKLNSRDDTLRFGGKVSFTLRPQGKHWNRISLLAGFTYDSAISGSPQKADLLDLGIKYQLDAADHFSTELNYQDGETNVVGTPTRQLMLKFGVKY